MLLADSLKRFGFLLHFPVEFHPGRRHLGILEKVVAHLPIACLAVLLDDEALTASRQIVEITSLLGCADRLFDPAFPAGQVSILRGFTLGRRHDHVLVSKQHCPNDTGVSGQMR